jgi:hypothetical protein
MFIGILGAFIGIVNQVEKLFSFSNRLLGSPETYKAKKGKEKI